MSELEYLKQLHIAGRIARREFLGRALAAGASAAVLSSLVASVDAHAAETPPKGGTLKLGLGGGSTTDSLDPASWNDSVMASAGNGFLDGLIEVGPDNKAVPALATSWESKPGALEWVFNLRRGVTFHNGKPFGVDDAIFSINMHRGKTKSGAAGSFSGIADVKKSGDMQFTVTLGSGDADFPMVLTDYHCRMVPEATTDFSKAIGTGGYALVQFDPGVRIQGKRSPNYWNPGRANVDSFDMTVINDSAARMNALISSQVDIVNRVDPKIANLIKGKANLSLVDNPAPWHTLASLMQDKGQFYENGDLRRALAYSIDRVQIVKTLFQGYGSIGNDTPIGKNDPYHNPNIPQRAFDPEKAKFYLKKSGFDGTVVVQVSDAAFNGAVDMATLWQASAVKCGIKLDVKKEPADGFWDNVWLKGNSVVSYWAGRATATAMLDVAYKDNAPWNESHFKNAKFNQLLIAAKAELDESKRKQMLYDCQTIMHEEVATVVPAFRNNLDAHNNKVGGHTPHGLSNLNNNDIISKAWIKT